MSELTSNSAVYEVQEGMDRDLNKQFRVTDTRTDSRVATCYVQSNADLVCAALNAYTADEPSAGVKCTHCNGKGYNEPIYDEQDGWTDETPCETCNGSGRITTVEQYLKTLPANWHEDSSLETWFPITAEELKRLKDARATVPPSASDEFPADCDVIDITCDEDDERVIEFAFVRDDICVKGQSVTKEESR